MKSLILIFLSFLVFNTVNAQYQTDSAVVYAIAEEIFTVCNSASPEGENSDIIIFERLSKYILYTGSDVSRKNKTYCEYNNAEDRKIVDESGFKIKKWLDNIKNYSLGEYQNKKEGAIDKHILLFEYKSGKSKKERSFVFVKIKNEFLLMEVR